MTDETTSDQSRPNVARRALRRLGQPIMTSRFGTKLRRSRLGRSAAVVWRYRRALILGGTASAATGLLWWTCTAHGANPLVMQFPSSDVAFKNLFMEGGRLAAPLIDATREALDRETWFIASYVIVLVSWIYATGRSRCLGGPLGVLLASAAAVGAGWLDVLENRALREQLAALEAGGQIAAGGIRGHAIDKWVLLTVVLVYIWVRSLGTPRRRLHVPAPGTRYQLRFWKTIDTRDHPSTSSTQEQAKLRVGVFQEVQKTFQDRKGKAGEAAHWMLGIPQRIKKRREQARKIWEWIFGKRPDPGPGPELDQQITRGSLGVACSGGGIRSASFTLGALQVLREEGVLEKASHVTAASGGGYIAAGWAVAASSQPAEAEDVFAPGSPEEHWLRRHSSLLPDVPTTLHGVGQALAGLVANLVLLFLILFVVARPIGYIVHETHPELRGRQPYVAIGDQPELNRSPSEPKHVPMVGFHRLTADQITCKCDEPLQAWEVDFVREAGTGDDAFTGAEIRVWSDSEPSVSDEREPLEVDRAVVAVTDGKLTVVRQPAAHVPEALAAKVRGTIDGDVMALAERVKARKGADGRAVALAAEVLSTSSDRSLDPAVRDLAEGVQAGWGADAEVVRLARTVLDKVLAESSADPDVLALIIARQPRLTVVDASVPGDEPQAAQLRVTTPRLEQRSGTTGRRDLEFGRGMGWMTFGLAAFAAVQVLRLIWRPARRGGTVVFAWLGWVTGGAAFALVMLVVAIPWLVHEVPTAVARLVTALPGPDTDLGETGAANTTTIIGGSALLVVATVARMLRGPVLAAARRWPMVISKLVVAAVLVVVPFLLLISQIELAAANGPSGHLVDFGATSTSRWADVLRAIPDVVRLMAAMGILLAWRYALDAHATSLFPYYKRRLSESFAVERKRNGDTLAREVPYEVELAWTDVDEIPVKGYGRFHLGGGVRKQRPELVLCCAVNAYGAGEVATGRRCSSFTFSPTVIGGPDVGYLRTEDYLCRLGRARRKDVTVPASVAISGAAFGPGMGKMSMGPIDNLMGIVNARLGVWLPHPGYVAERDTTHRWYDGPGWPQLLREMFGLFRLRLPYIYVTDGGHWENLGVVELLRRGCRDIVVISAAGDGADSFSTIGDAIALAREELGIEFAVDLAPMRAGWHEAGEPATEPTLRRGPAREPMPVAAKPFALGRLRERVNGTWQDVGNVLILEANLTSKLPWDVASWAEGRRIFPDDPTSNQRFNHRQFESYRRLGRFQMTAALSDSEVWSALGMSAAPVPEGDPSIPRPPSTVGAVSNGNGFVPAGQNGDAAGPRRRGFGVRAQVAAARRSRQ